MSTVCTRCGLPYPHHRDPCAPRRPDDFTETERRLARMYAEVVAELTILRAAVERETTSLPMVRRRILGAVEG